MSVLEHEPFAFFAVKTWEAGRKMSYPHFHDHHELYFLKSGKTKYFIGTEIYILEPGDIAFIPKGTYHKTEYYTSTNAERLLLIFDDDFLSGEYTEYLNELKAEPHVKIHADKLSKFHRLFNRIEEECKEQSKDYVKMQQLNLSQLLIMISRYKQSSCTLELSKSDVIIQNATRYIALNFAEDLSLESLAKKYAVSPGYFSKLFKRMTGTNLSDYIAISRITAAKNLLSTQDKNITDIALECGFNDSAYFSKTFKKITGVSPKAFQNHYKPQKNNLDEDSKK